MKKTSSRRALALRGGAGIEPYVTFWQGMTMAAHGREDRHSRFYEISDNLPPAWRAGGVGASHAATSCPRTKPIAEGSDMFRKKFRPPDEVHRLWMHATW